MGSYCNNLGQRGDLEQGGCSRGGEKISVKNLVNESTKLEQLDLLFKVTKLWSGRLSEDKLALIHWALLLLIS